MKRAALLLVMGALLAISGPAASQDTLKGLGRVHGYTGVVFDTRTARYDILVDASRPEDPAARRYKTLQAAYAAAPAGTRDKPTVIGLMPDVYLLHGTPDAPGLSITKANITLVGLTDDRRKVVIADNRGNKQGANNNGWSLNVDADGFSAINLTFLNYCNVDYDYPGDPSKSLKRRSGVITQALALQASGDRHTYSHVAFLSRLDTLANRTARSYFTHVYIEGTDDFVGQRGPSVWEDSEVNFIEGGGILYGGGTTFIRTRFRATKPMQFYKILLPPDALIDSTLPNVPVAWHAWRVTAPINEHSLTFRTRHENGKTPDIIDSIIGAPKRTAGRELTEEQANAFNPWNILRWTASGADDGWDPAGVRAKYEPLGVLPTRMVLTNGAPRIRTTEAPVRISAKVLPMGATKTIRWETASPFVKLDRTTGETITVTAANTTTRTQTVAIRALADNGFSATAWVTVDPPWQPSPALTGEPTLRASPGKLHLDYTLPLAAGRIDQSVVTWFVCDARVCASPRRVAVSRAGKPLKTLNLTPAMARRYIMATVEPAHDLSKPGPAYRVASRDPIPAQPTTAAVLDVASLPDTTAADRWDGDWSLTGEWTSEAPMDGEPRFGLRAGAAPNTLLYTGRREAGDMDLTVVFDTDKLEGQGFGLASTPADDAPQRADIFFKYDAATRTGYALRFWRTVQSHQAVMFQLYRITGGKGEPVGAQQLTGVLKPTITIRITVRGRQVTVTGRNTQDGETLSLKADLPVNRHAGAGVFWAPTRRGGAIVVRSLRVVIRD